MLCRQCGEMKSWYDYMDGSMCSGQCLQCAHDAGDRSVCSQMRECGCTEFAKVRRLLRNHRRAMRIMDSLIYEHSLDDELSSRLDDSIDFNLDMDDFESDQDDPQAIAESKIRELLAESKDKTSFIDAVSGALESRAMATDLERARMQLEDSRAQTLRCTSGATPRTP